MVVHSKNIIYLCEKKKKKPIEFESRKIIIITRAGQ